MIILILIKRIIQLTNTNSDSNSNNF